MSRVEYLKDSEPFFKGDIVDVADDAVEYLVDQKIVKEVDAKTPLFSKGVELTQDGVSMQDKEYAKKMASAGSEGKKKVTKAGSNEEKEEKKKEEEKDSK